MTSNPPMDLLKELSPEFAANQMDAKKLLFEDSRYQLVPNQYKLLARIAGAAVLGSGTCTDMWTKQARWNNLDKIWMLSSNKADLAKYIQDEVRIMLDATK